jgi:cytochrome bd ubiquinol oxidase subunit II
MHPWHPRQVFLIGQEQHHNKEEDEVSTQHHHHTKHVERKGHIGHQLVHVLDITVTEIGYIIFQHYWWFVVSLLGALLVFLLFVQGGNSLLFCLGKTEEQKKMMINSTGRKWEFTFTTLVTFGGAFFASFPLFYSTSFGGAYWLWMIILFSFVLQAVSYEFQSKAGNLLGKTTYRTFLVINGVVGPVLLGGAVATFFTGSNFYINKGNIADAAMPVISQWANGWHGLDALLNPWNVVLGLAVFFLARILGALYFINNINEDDLVKRCRR